jgi:hypothetical protein
VVRGYRRSVPPVALTLFCRPVSLSSGAPLRGPEGSAADEQAAKDPSTPLRMRMTVTALSMTMTPLSVTQTVSLSGQGRLAVEDLADKDLIVR